MPLSRPTSAFVQPKIFSYSIRDFLRTQISTVHPLLGSTSTARAAPSHAKTHHVYTGMESISAAKQFDLTIQKHQRICEIESTTCPITRTSLKFENWPEADRSMWTGLTAAGSPLDGAGAGAHWAAETRRAAAREYGHWLSFALTTAPDAARSDPLSRVTPGRVRLYCRSMEDVSARTRATRIARLHTIMRGADPAKNLRWLAEMRRALERAARRAGPARSKQGRLLPSGKLYDAGLALAQRARLVCDGRPGARARDVRDGLLIALLAARPLRIKNFAGLRLGRHVHATSSGYLIDIPGSECKTANPIEVPVPEDLCPWLDDYLATYRPLLLAGRQSDSLWVHNTGGSYTPGHLSQRIRKLTKGLVGVPISPHLFRDCAATTIAIDDPEHVLTIAPLLGHTTLKTSEKHYNHARSLDASRRFQAVMREVRARGLPLRRRPSRGRP